MCYFTSIKSNTRDIVKEFDVIFPLSESFQPAYSVSAFTFPKIPVISSASPDSITLYSWGLIPFWVNNWEQAMSLRQKTLNARSETIFEKPAFSLSIRTKRCLVIADGFFEWRHINKKIYPYYITLKSRILFSLAGIWDSWTNPETNESLNTFAVVTTEANSLMAKVHNSRKRMPVILPKGSESVWLDLRSDYILIKELMKSYDATDMQAYPISNKLNRLGYNTTDPSVNIPVEYDELPKID